MISYIYYALLAIFIVLIGDLCEYFNIIVIPCCFIEYILYIQRNICMSIYQLYGKRVKFFYVFKYIQNLSLKLLRSILFVFLKLFKVFSFKNVIYYMSYIIKLVYKSYNTYCKNIISNGIKKIYNNIIKKNKWHPTKRCVRLTRYSINSPNCLYLTSHHTGNNEIYITDDRRNNRGFSDNRKILNYDNNSSNYTPSHCDRSIYDGNSTPNTTDMELQRNVRVVHENDRRIIYFDVNSNTVRSSNRELRSVSNTDNSNNLHVRDLNDYYSNQAIIGSNNSESYINISNDTISGLSTDTSNSTTYIIIYYLIQYNLWDYN